jgi:hypothetical protein
VRHLRAIVVAFLIAPGGALAGSDMAGIGTSSCANFAKDYGRNPAAAESLYMAWAAGFMTAWNIGVRNGGGPPLDLSAKTFEQHKEFMRDYCNAHPLARYVEGVVELIGTLPTY